MNSKIKKAFTVFLTTSMVMGSLAMTAHADVDQKALDRINQIRQEAANEGLVSNYVPMQWSSDMEEVASIRAQENVSGGQMSHQRPGGLDFWTAESSTGQTSQSEVLAWRWPAANNALAVEAWYSEKAAYIAANGVLTEENMNDIGHYYALINPANQYVGLSTQGAYTAGEFSGIPGTAAPVPAPSQAAAPSAAPAPAQTAAAPAAQTAEAPAAQTPEAPAQAAAAPAAQTPAPAAAPAAPTVSAPRQAAPGTASLPRDLTPVSVSLIKAMNALSDMTNEIPEMTPVVANVNAAISQVIPVVENAAEDLYPTEAIPASGSASGEAIDPVVSNYIAQAEAWIETTYDMLAE